MRVDGKEIEPPTLEVGVGYEYTLRSFRTDEKMESCLGCPIYNSTYDECSVDEVGQIATTESGGRPWNCPLIEKELLVCRKNTKND